MFFCHLSQLPVYRRKVELVRRKFDLLLEKARRPFFIFIVFSMPWLCPTRFHGPLRACLRNACSWLLTRLTCDAQLDAQLDSSSSSSSSTSVLTAPATKDNRVVRYVYVCCCSNESVLDGVADEAETADEVLDRNESVHSALLRPCLLFVFVYRVSFVQALSSQRRR